MVGKRKKGSQPTGQQCVRYRQTTTSETTGTLSFSVNSYVLVDFSTETKSSGIVEYFDTGYCVSSSHSCLFLVSTLLYIYVLPIVVRLFSNITKLDIRRPLFFFYVHFYTCTKCCT